MICLGLLLVYRTVTLVGSRGGIGALNYHYILIGDVASALFLEKSWAGQRLRRLSAPLTAPVQLSYT